MGQRPDFPNDRLRWMDDLLAELEKFAGRYELRDLHEDLTRARSTLLIEAKRINETPGHPVNKVRGLRDH